LRTQIELLAPGGDLDSIRAAIAAGTNAIYCGLDRFNARNRANNLSLSDLRCVIQMAHQHQCQVFLTLNIVIVENELIALVDLLNKIVNTHVDAVIVQDLGLLYLLKKFFPQLKAHASTQLTTHNGGQVKFLAHLDVTRVNLSRELSLKEISEVSVISKSHKVEIEVFVHGSQCLSFSGLCYISSVQNGSSGNRGRCGQPCRDAYEITAQGKTYPLNLKDNSAYFDLPQLIASGVDSLKIEGRIKKYPYVYKVVTAWRNQIDRFFLNQTLITSKTELYSVFNRDLSNSFLLGDLSKQTFIDSPRDYSALYLATQHDSQAQQTLENAKQELFELKAILNDTVEQKISSVHIGLRPVVITVKGAFNEPLSVLVETEELRFTVTSSVLLKKTRVDVLDDEALLKRFKVINETDCFIKSIHTQGLEKDLYLPFQQVNALRDEILHGLMGKRMVPPVVLKPIVVAENQVVLPRLSIIIDALDDAYLSDDTDVRVFLSLPNCLVGRQEELLAVFSSFPRLIPYFPAVLIGEDYTQAVAFLNQLHPSLILTDNTGIAYEAYERGIAWLAGIHLNLTNSYALKCLKDYFLCRGAYVSNELKKMQLKVLKAPDDFELIYSVYHPQKVMTSRACLFFQTSGCSKSKMDDSCLSTCAKETTITNAKSDVLYITKKKGQYNAIYHSSNFLNLAIVTELPNKFSSLSVDLSSIRTQTKPINNKKHVIGLFKDCIDDHSQAAIELQQLLSPSSHAQYKRGL